MQPSLKMMTQSALLALLFCANTVHSGLMNDSTTAIVVRDVNAKEVSQATVAVTSICLTLVTYINFAF